MYVVMGHSLICFCVMYVVMGHSLVCFSTSFEVLNFKEVQQNLRSFINLKKNMLLRESIAKFKKI